VAVVWNCASFCQAQKEEALPPALTEYMGRTIAPTMHYSEAPWLVRESRQREEDWRTMLAQLGVQPGMMVCDMGCGNGFYTLKLAEMVGAEGKVYAVDIQPEMLRLLQARAEEAGLTERIEAILGTVVDPKLPEKSLDVILCVDVYHEFSHPEQMLLQMHKALKTTGRLVLLEFRAEDPEVPIRPLHKMSKAQARKELEANGFELAEQFDNLPWQHMLLFRKQPE
jgi:ubiquinone/menaquinone biosynthesis C-methylase UbiE